MVPNRRRINHGYQDHEKSAHQNHKEGTDTYPQIEMNNTQKALWFSGIFSAVLTAVIVSVVNDARHKLEKAVIDNVRQDSEIKHNADNYDSLELQMRELMNVAIGTNNAVIRVEERLKSFERAEQ